MFHMLSAFWADDYRFRFASPVAKVIGVLHTLVIKKRRFGTVLKSQYIAGLTPRPWGESDSKYLIHSSVFGRIVTEAEKTGKKWRTFVFANGSELARQAVAESGTRTVTYGYRDAHGLSGGTGLVPLPGFEHFYLREELDGLGNNVGKEAVENPLDEPQNSRSPVDRSIFESMDMGFCNEQVFLVRAI